MGSLRPSVVPLDTRPACRLASILAATRPAPPAPCLGIVARYLSCAGSLFSAVTVSNLVSATLMQSLTGWYLQVFQTHRHALLDGNAAMRWRSHRLLDAKHPFEDKHGWRGSRQLSDDGECRSYSAIMYSQCLALWTGEQRARLEQVRVLRVFLQPQPRVVGAVVVVQLVLLVAGFDQRVPSACAGRSCRPRTSGGVPARLPWRNGRTVGRRAGSRCETPRTVSRAGSGSSRMRTGRSC